MKKSSEIISGCATIIFLTALVVWIFCFAKINSSFEIMEIQFPFLFAANLFCYLLDCFLLKKGIPFSVYALLQILLTGGGVFLFLKSIQLEPFVLGTCIFTCILYALTIPVAAYIAYEPVQESGISIRFDLAAFMLIILLVLEKWILFPAGNAALVSCLIAILASLIALLLNRIGKYGTSPSHVEGNRNLGKIIILIVAVIIAAFTAIVYFFAAGKMEQAAGSIVSFFKWLAGIIKAAASYIWEWINRFFLWLASLFPAEETEISLDGLEAVNFDSASSEVISAEVPLWFYIILGAILVGFFLFIIFRLRYKHLKRIGKMLISNNSTVQKKSGLKKALKDLFHTIVLKLRFRINLIRYRNQIPGLLIWCEKKAGHNLPRLKGESSSAYIRRAAKYLSDNEGQTIHSGENAAFILFNFADIVEKNFYSKTKLQISTDNCRKIKKIFKNICKIKIRDM